MSVSVDDEKNTINFRFKFSFKYFLKTLNLVINKLNDLIREIKKREILLRTVKVSNSRKRILSRIKIIVEISRWGLKLQEELDTTTMKLDN